MLVVESLVMNGRRIGWFSVVIARWYFTSVRAMLKLLYICLGSISLINRCAH